MIENYFTKIFDLGFEVTIYRNDIRTISMIAGRDGDPADPDKLGEWRVLDFTDQESVHDAARRLYEKLTCTGEYADWDRKIRDLMKGRAGPFLIGMDYRPASERIEVPA